MGSENFRLNVAARALVLFGLMWLLRTRIRTPGVLFWIFIGLFGLTRIPLDMTRSYEAEAQIAHIEQRIPRLRIEIDGLRADDRVSLDQARVYPDELGHDMWLDPGVHTVRVERPRGDQEVRTIAVAEGQIRVLAFRLP